MKLNAKRTVLVGLAFLSISAFWQMYDNVVPLVLKNTFDIPDDIAGIIMALDNVLALFLLPLFGKLSDGCRTPIGKRMPFILGGTAAAAVLMQLLPFADRTHNLVLFVAALGLLLISMGTYRSPAVALMPDVTPKPLRSKGNAIINLMGALGGVFTLAMIGLLVSKDAAGKELASVDLGDTHTGKVVDDRSMGMLRAYDFLPFQKGINAGVGAVMVSHSIVNAIDSSWPATLSAEVHRVLRDELGFHGVIITDDLAMGAITELYDPGEAAVQAILAGNDLLLTNWSEGQYQAILDAVAEGRISADVIRRSCIRIVQWKMDLGLL